MLDVLTFIVAAIGAVGGAAGFLALFMQHQDREARARVAHFPPELRQILLQIADTAAQVERSPRDRSWCHQHIGPLAGQFEPLAALVEESNSSDGSTCALLQAHLSAIRAYTSNDFVKESGAEIARTAQQQAESAREAVRVARILLRRMNGERVSI